MGRERDKPLDPVRALGRAFIQPAPRFTLTFPAQQSCLGCESPGSLGSLKWRSEPLGFGEGAGRLTLGQSSPAYPARTEKEPMSKTSAPTSSVRGDRSVRGSLPNSLPLYSSEGRSGQSHSLATFNTRLGMWELGLESGILRVGVKPLEPLLAQWPCSSHSLFWEGRGRGPGGGGLNGGEVGPGKSERPGRIESRSGAGPKPGAGPARTQR